MTVIYSSSALKTKQREVKDAALTDVVHITENGNGAFVFCSEEIFDKKLQEAADQAVYEERVRAAVRAGRDDVAAGRTYGSLEEALQAAAALRDSNG